MRVMRQASSVEMLELMRYACIHTAVRKDQAEVRHKRKNHASGNEPESLQVTLRMFVT